MSFARIHGATRHHMRVLFASAKDTSRRILYERGLFGYAAFPWPLLHQSRRRQTERSRQCQAHSFSEHPPSPITSGPAPVDQPVAHPHTPCLHAST